MFGLASMLATFSTVGDILDGQVARLTKTGSNRGELLDAAVDRYTEFAFLAGVLIYFRDSVWWMLLTLAAMLASFMVSYASAKAEALQVSPPRGLMRRHERGTYLIAGVGLLRDVRGLAPRALDGPPLGSPADRSARRGRRDRQWLRRFCDSCASAARCRSSKRVMPQPANQNRKLVTPIPGPKSQALRDREEAHLAPGAQGYALMAGIVVDHAEGTTITDVDGNTFLDFIGGIGVGALGPLAPDVGRGGAEAGGARGGRLAHRARPASSCSSGSRAHAPAKGVHRLQLYSGGAEAVESALRLAKSHTGKYEFVSFWGGFHGKTMGALSLMGSTFKDKLGPMVPGRHQVPYADCYRCPLELDVSDLRPRVRRGRAQVGQDRDRGRGRRRSSSSRCRARPATSSRRRSSCRR